MCDRRWRRWCGDAKGRCFVPRATGVASAWAGLEYREGLSYLGGLRLDLTGTRERTVDLTHVGGLSGCMELSESSVGGGGVSFREPEGFVRADFSTGVPRGEAEVRR